MTPFPVVNLSLSSFQQELALSMITWSSGSSLAAAGAAASDATTTTGGSTLIMGVEPALFAMIVLAVVCCLVCVIGRSSERKMVLVSCAVFLASVTALFFFSVNIESQEDVSVKKLRYNQMAVTRSAVAATMIGFSVLALFSVLLMHVIKPRQGRFIGERARHLDRPRLI